MVLGDVEETLTTTETDEETLETIIKVRWPVAGAVWAHRMCAALTPCPFSQKTKRNMAMLYVRGDTVILVSPPLRTA